MSRKFRQAGDIIEYTNAGAAILAGAVVVMLDMVGIALVDIATGGKGSVAIEGVFEVPKVAGTAWVIGDRLDWDASAAAFAREPTPAAGDVDKGVICTKAAASGDVVGEVKLCPGTGVRV